VRWLRASRSDLPEPGAEVAYDWPDGGGAPFEVSADETRWVLVAGSRFGRTWPAGDPRDFGSWGPDFERRVPMGYKVIQIAERLAVVEQGRVLREWPETGLRWDGYPPTPPVFDPYQNHVPGTQPSSTYAALDGRGGERGPDRRWISHQHDSYAAALAEARTMTDRRVLVVSLLTTKDWH
jgi:hypothetical protein